MTRNWEVLKKDPKEQEYCKQLYLSGEGWTQQKLADLYNVSYGSMKYFIQKQGWKKKRNMDNPQNKRKFSVNDNFFSEENPIMAYWLGFISADGYCPTATNEVGIGLALIDRDHLEQLREDLQTDREVKEYVNNQGYSVCKLVVTSKKMREDLAKYGVVPNKTFTLNFPSILNRKYWIDYIRGYFDGDGSVSYLKNQHALRWQICGAKEDFLQAIVDFFYEEYGIPKVNIQIQTENRKHPLYCFQYSTRATEDIYKILYPEGCRRLKRKYVKFKEAIEQHNLDIL